LKIKTDQETEFDVLLKGEHMNQFSRVGHQWIELIPMFKVYADGGECNATCALARYDIHTNYNAC
jgi:hypothetical protein